MPFDHNDHYHPLLLRQVPSGAATALDVGCGTGRFARRLAAAGLDVHAVDADPGVIAAATPAERVRYTCADVSTMDFSVRRYDVITCLAVLHHLPFDTVSLLRNALRPGGVLAILGLAHPSGARDLVRWGALAPVANLAARAAVACGERLNGGVHSGVQAPVRGWDMSLSDIRRDAAGLLPGSTVRPLLFWRYLLTYRQPA